MDQVITINLKNREKERLSRIALFYGLSLPELFHKLILELEHTLPTERLEDYDNPRAVKASLNRAMKDLKAGRVSRSLWN